MKFVVFKDTNGQYRWRFVSSNSRIVAISGEGYINKSDCLAGIELVKKHAGTAAIEDSTAASAAWR
jgi:uncharacterized protein YegP (UPF0339 family)